MKTDRESDTTRKRKGERERERETGAARQSD